MEPQTGDDQSFEDFLSACSDGFLKCQYIDILSNGQQKHGREQRKRNSSSSANTSDGRDQDLIQMMARLAVRQEDTLNQLGLDCNLMMFLQRGRGSLMPTLLETGRQWNTQRQNDDASTSLRQTKFLTVFQELISRANKLQLNQKDDTLIMGLKAKGILTEDNK